MAYLNQTSFAGGEIAPSLRIRVDLQKYQSSLAKARNCFIHTTGGVSNRTGFRYIGTTKLSNRRSILVPFEFSTTDALVLEFGHCYVRFFANAQPVLAGPVPYEIVTSYQESDLPQLKFAQSADVIYICHPNYPPQELIRNDNSNWTLQDFAFINGPFMMANANKEQTITPSAISGSITLTSNFDPFVPGQVGSLIKLSHYRESKVASGSFGATGIGPLVEGKGDWRLITHGTWAGKFRIEKSTDDGTTWTCYRAYSGNSDYNVNVTGTEDTYCLYRINMTNWTSGTMTYDLTFDAAYYDGHAVIDSVIDDQNATATVLERLGGTGATDNWAMGSWSDSNGWPQAVAFYQDRLWFAGTTAEPASYWSSKTGDYYNFGRSSPLEDTDGITSSLMARKINPIQSLIPLVDVVALTSGAEWKIGSAGGALTPMSISSNIQGYRGASNVEPCVIGNRAIYVQQMGGVVRDIGYSFESDGYTGDDISPMASHLFKGYTIVDMCYQQEPDSIVWLVRNDGKLISLTYNREQQMAAYCWHDTLGEFEAVCSIPGDGYNAVYAIVKRGDYRFVEVLTKRPVSTHPKDYCMVDSAITYDGVSTNQITGLDRLEGQVVSVLIDGFVCNDQTVTGGVVNLPFSGSYIHVGLKYISDVETLAIELQDNKGSVASRKMQIPEVTIYFEKALGGVMGIDESKLSVEILQRTTEPLDQPVMLQTGFKTMSLPTDYRVGGKILFRQERPLPFSILSIIPNFQIGG